jgi:DNA-binding XRE family transcriptional regulator
MERDWARLGAALRAARNKHGRSQAEIGEAIGIKRGAMRNIEKGSIDRVTPTVRAYAREVGWADGSIEDVLAGGEPTYRDDESTPGAADSAAVLAPVPEELPVRIKAALEASGAVLDTAVIPLPGDDGASDAQIVVVVKSRRDALTPEQLRRALEEWERAEGHLRGLHDGA